MARCRIHLIGARDLCSQKHQFTTKSSLRERRREIVRETSALLTSTPTSSNQSRFVIRSNIEKERGDLRSIYNTRRLPDARRKQKEPRARDHRTCSHLKGPPPPRIKPQVLRSQEDNGEILGIPTSRREDLYKLGFNKSSRWAAARH